MLLFGSLSHVRLAMMLLSLSHFDLTTTFGAIRNSG